MKALKTIALILLIGRFAFAQEQVQPPPAPAPATAPVVTTDTTSAVAPAPEPAAAPPSEPAKVAEPVEAPTPVPEPVKPVEPKKIAVYVSGAKDANINKSFGNKLLATIIKGDKYVEIRDMETFYGELSKNPKVKVAQIVQTAKKHGADFVCVMNLVEALGEYAISAGIIRISDSKAVRTATLDRSLKSLDDLTNASDVLVNLLLRQSQSPQPIKSPKYESPAKFTVYVSGASDVGVNKSLSNKLIAGITQSGMYSEIGNVEAFNEEMSKNPKAGITQIAQTAKKYKAEEVFLVNLTETFGEYSVTARIMSADGSIVEMVSLDYTLKSLKDLSKLSREIISKLIYFELPEEPAVKSAPAAASTGSATEVVSGTSVTQAPVQPSQPSPSQRPVVVEKCNTKYNKNELLYNVREGFLLGFKNCATELVKETVLAKSPFAKKPAPEPGSFITQCVMGSIKEKVNDVPGGEKITNVVENFLQTLLKTALSGGDPKALVSAASNLDITGMMETISSFAKGSSCFVDAPYEPPVVTSGSGSDGDDDSFFSSGFRWGINFSANDGNGSQFGFVFDFALSDWLHFQPNIMLIMKGYNAPYNALYLEVPLLTSFKFSAFRFNVGPYFAVGSDEDFGISTGLGFDIGSLYIGTFWDYGLVKQGDCGYRYYDECYYNNTLGFNIGVNTTNGEVGENFGVGRRIGTIALNALPGIGSLALMGDLAGAITQWVLVGGGAIFIGNINTENVGVAMIGSWPFYAIYRSITYDKPKEVAHSKYGSLNMAVLPNSKGDGVAYGLIYRMGF